jgi:DNA-binding transcriptional ArsR family regulator
MVEQVFDLDVIFASLSDPTRRDIIRRISLNGMSIGAIARNYQISFAGVAKHLDVLERAGLIRKTRKGKEQIVTIDPTGLAAANGYLEPYRQLWEQRLDSLDAFLQATNQKDETND